MLWPNFPKKSKQVKNIQNSINYWWLRLLACEKNLPEFSLARVIAYVVHHESRNYDAAALSLELCLAHSPWATKPMRNALYCDAAILQAKRRRMELAEALVRRHSSEYEIGV